MANEDRAYDPFGAGGPGAYGGTMLGGVSTRRRHISERGQHPDGRPLKGDPLATLRLAREKLTGEIQALQQKLAEIDGKLESIGENQPQQRRPQRRERERAPAQLPTEIETHQLETSVETHQYMTEVQPPQFATEAEKEIVVNEPDQTDAAITAGAEFRSIDAPTDAEPANPTPAEPKQAGIQLDGEPGRKTKAARRS